MSSASLEIVPRILPCPPSPIQLGQVLGTFFLDFLRFSGMDPPVQHNSIHPGFAAARETPAMGDPVNTISERVETGSSAAVTDSPDHPATNSRSPLKPVATSRHPFPLHPEPASRQNRLDLPGFGRPHFSPSVLPPPVPLRHKSTSLQNRVGFAWMSLDLAFLTPARPRFPLPVPPSSRPSSRQNKLDLLGFTWITLDRPGRTRPRSKRSSL